MDQVTSLFTALAGKEEIEEIRREIQELKISLNTKLPDAVKELIQESIKQKLQTLDNLENNIANIR